MCKQQPISTYLMSKLITGHTQNNKSLFRVPPVELVHLSVVPGCCSSKRRHILNENNFVLQGRKTKAFSRQHLSCQVVKPFHIACHSHKFSGWITKSSRFKEKETFSLSELGGPMLSSSFYVQSYFFFMGGTGCISNYSQS